VTAERDLATAAVDQATTALSGADVDVSANRHRLALTRFANSVIHQNVAEDATSVRIQIHHAGRTAAAAATVTDEAELRTLVERAIETVRVAPRDPGWPGLASPAEPGSSSPVGAASADASPADRAEIVRAFVDGAGGLEAAGYCRTNHWSGGFANSAGQTLIGEAGECGLSGIARRDGADGVARHAPLRLTELDGHVLGARAAAKALAWTEPIELPAGRYEVVLEPTAVADILETLAAAGFNGKAVNEQRSFVRLNTDQFDPAITIVDDPLAAGYGYDNEGTPRSRLVLVERGTTKSLTHDRRSAAEADAVSTGHAGEMSVSWGPVARHVGVLPSGDEFSVAGEVDGPIADSSVATLVAGVERGVLVSDFWYTRMLDPRTLAITGLTRNGVWLIENGSVTSPLHNFRFTQSYAQALMPGNVRAVGRTATPVPGDTYTATSPRWSCPALHLASWNFTGGASG
jgi:predicted Zn-dependent protease